MSRENRPLMYIEQPEFGVISFDEQVTEVKAVSSQEVENERIDQEEHDLVEHDQYDETESISVTESENVIEHGVRKNAFVNQTLEEKLQFLTSLPNNMPPVICEVKTKEKSLQGTVLSYADRLVSFQVEKSTHTLDIPVDEIDSLSIVSL